MTENFHEYQGSLGRLEAAVEDEYKTNLRYACNRERNYSKFYSFDFLSIFIPQSKMGIFFFTEESMLMKARNFGSKDLYRKAQLIETPSCKKFEEFKQNGRF